MVGINRTMTRKKTLWDKSLWTALVITALLLWGEYALVSYECDRLTKKRNKELRDTYSPMSTDPEIQRAYDEVREPVFDLEAYIVDGDTLATENM
jgi:hypothetical protein